MWQTSKNLGVWVDSWPCSEGDFLTGSPKILDDLSRYLVCRGLNGGNTLVRSTQILTLFWYSWGFSVNMSAATLFAGSKGFGSSSSCWMENRIPVTLRQESHLLPKISRHILPSDILSVWPSTWAYTFGWKIFVINLTRDGLNGYSLQKFIFSLNLPPENNEFARPQTSAINTISSFSSNSTVIPGWGWLWRLLTSTIKRLKAGVVILSNVLLSFLLNISRNFRQVVWFSWIVWMTKIKQFHVFIKIVPLKKANSQCNY